METQTETVKIVGAQEGESCPRCLMYSKTSLLTHSCMYCGFKFSDFVRYDIVPYERLNEKEGWMWEVARRRRLARLKPHEQKIFMQVLMTLRENHEYYFDAYELKQKFNLSTVRTITRSLYYMHELGMVKITVSEGRRWYKYEVTGYSSYEKKEKKTKDEVQNERLHEHVTNMNDKKVCRYIQMEDEDGEYQGKFVWVSPELAKEIDEYYANKAEEKKKVK